MKNKKNLIVISTISTAIIMLALLLVLTLVCFHRWNDATCDAPMTCEKCEKTKGIALPHEWIEATCKEAKHCMRCGFSDGEPIEHSWENATCETAKTCSVCGLIDGEPLGHSWKDATCEIAKTCSACDLIDGKPLEHSINDWKITKETSCSTEGERTGICDQCQKEFIEKIEKLPHTKSNWQIKKDFIINSDGTIVAGIEETICLVCNAELETREYTIELTLSQQNAAICAYNQINFWHCGPDFLIHELLADYEGYPISDAKFVVAHMAVDWDEQAILYAKENSKGTSRTNLINEMNHYGFNKTQIGNALKEVGY